jgi:hypothetical protein
MAAKYGENFTGVLRAIAEVWGEGEFVFTEFY